MPEISRRVAAKYLLSSFQTGDIVFYGRGRDKTAVTIRVWADERGVPFIEVQPIPRGKKHNRVFSLYTVHKVTADEAVKAQAVKDRLTQPLDT